MQIKPILSALRRHKAGTVLIAMQIALTLAIVCNALFIIQQRVAHMSEPTGIDEGNIFVIQNEWVGSPSSEQADADSRAGAESTGNARLGNRGKERPCTATASPSGAICGNCEPLCFSEK